MNEDMLLRLLYAFGPFDTLLLIGVVLFFVCAAITTLWHTVENYIRWM